MAKRAQAAQEGAQHTRDIPPVRVADLNGHMWSVPPGNRLYTELRRDQEAGYTEQFVDSTALRHPEYGVGAGMTNEEAARVYDGNTWLLEHGYRQGQLLLLRERVKARG